MNGHFLLYNEAFRLEDWSTLYEKIETLANMIQKAKKHGDTFAQSHNPIGEIEILSGLKYFDLLNPAQYEIAMQEIPNFSHDIIILVTEILGYYPTELGVNTLEEMDIESELTTPNILKNNGLVGLYFENIPYINLLKCVWNIDSWFDFHFRFYHQNPQQTYFIEVLQKQQDKDFNPFFPNIAYSNTLFAGKLSSEEIWKLFYKSEKNTKEKELYKDLFGAGDKVAVAKELAPKIAYRNLYKYNEELSNHNDKYNTNKKSTPYQIFEQGYGEHKTYLSTDFETPSFEVCDCKGRHLGEYLFSGKHNDEADKTGGHNILVS